MVFRSQITGTVLGFTVSNSQMPICEKKKNWGFLDGIWDVVLKKISLEIFENKSNCNWKFYNY